MIFITKEEFQGMDLETCNEVLTRVYNKAVEDIMLQLPTFALTMLRSVSNAEALRKKFVEDNADVAQNIDMFKKAILVQVEVNNPGLPYSDILERALKAVKEASGAPAN